MKTINELTKDIVLIVEDAFGNQITQTVKPQYPKEKEAIVGWKCPNCGAGMSPWAMRCTCQDVNHGIWY